MNAIEGGHRQLDTAPSVDTGIESPQASPHETSSEGGQEATAEPLEGKSPRSTEHEHRLAGRVADSFREYWSDITPRKRRAIAVGGAAVAATVLISTGIQIGSSEAQDGRSDRTEQPGDNQEPEDASPNSRSTDRDEEMAGEELAESGQEESDTPYLSTPEKSFDPDNQTETIDYDDGRRVERRFLTPYAANETTFYPDGSTNRSWRESDNEPLVPINHPLYEAMTGVSYENFVQNIEQTAPELTRDSYTAEEVVQGLYQRMMRTPQTPDPRYLEVLYLPGSEEYQFNNTYYKQIMEGDGDLSGAEHVIDFDEVLHYKPSDEDIEPMKDVSEATSFMARYTQESVFTEGDSEDEVVFTDLRATFKKHTIPQLGTVFVIEEFNN